MKRNIVFHNATSFFPVYDAWGNCQILVNGVDITDNSDYNTHIAKVNGAKYAENLALTHNKAFISRMTNWGVKFIDIGLDLGNVERTSRSVFYAAESQLLRNYWNYIFLS